MEEWALWYCFNKKEDDGEDQSSGTYEAELDEAWNEGSHYGGGTIDVDICDAQAYSFVNLYTASVGRVSSVSSYCVEIPESSTGFRVELSSN